MKRVTAFVILVCLTGTANAAIELPCTGEFKERKKLSPEAIQRVLRNHREWVSIEGHVLDDPRRANLCKANLSGMDLKGVDLSRANLRAANLAEAYLGRANLSGADLAGANLSGTNLSNADLTKANLLEVDLSGAWLARTKLKDVLLRRADLSGAMFEPSELPGADRFLGARGLSKLSFLFNVAPAIQLREEFRKAGFRSQAKAMTAAIRKFELKSASALEVFIQNYVAGGRLTNFGANPWGAFKWLILSIIVFFFPYFSALQFHRQKHGIWRCRPTQRILQYDGEPERELLPSGWVRSIPWALYFSILSAFRFGWGQLNLGNWVVQLQCREYTLDATGWVRSVAGVQSLFSLYLAVIFLATYFGEPFA